jgi:uncharacterized protein
VKRVYLYVALAFLLSWAWWVPMAFSGVHVGPGQAWPTHLPGLLGPAVAAIVTTVIFDGSAGVRHLLRRVVRWRLRWYPWAILGLTVLTTGISLVANPTATPTDYVTYSGAGEFGVVTIVYVLLVNGFGEEVGWRGFLAESFLTRYSLGVTSLVVGAMWALWHAPLFWIVDTFIHLGVGGTIGWLFGLLSGSVFLAWLYRGSGRSILIVALWHTAFNFTSATAASAGATAAVTSTLVMVAAAVILCLPSTWRGPTAAAPVFGNDGELPGA